jgi:hypothetical protein
MRNRKRIITAANKSNADGLGDDGLGAAMLGADGLRGAPINISKKKFAYFSRIARILES